HSNFGSGGSPNFDQEFSGWEAGVGYAFNSQWSAGLLGGTSESTIDPEAGGRLKLDAETLGAYVMYTPGNGLYFDLSYRGMNFDGNSQGGSDSQFSYSGDARGFSFEMGYGYKTSNGLIIEPQLQYSAVSVEMDTLTYNSADFELKDGDAALLRIGAAIRKSYKTSGGSYWTPYGALSYLDASDSENSYEIGGLLVGDNDTSGGSVLAEAGVTGYVGKWGMSGGVNWRNGGAYDGVFGGQVSVRYDW
ncbi:MAG TPA: autotransporter outer membrane beta-barrel domain-containing protein, partial [Arenimonas sp.]|nr:autotransporter outer membrane beta-barrel domain-containing protein [Arenimonas sp.]